MALTYCGCGHDDSRHHPAGRCAVTLPPFFEEELPAWRCPCRRFRAEPSSLSVLRSVQSCTVRTAAHLPDQRRCPELVDDAGRSSRLLPSWGA